MPIRGWRRFQLAAVLAASAGCAFDVDFTAARFRCESAADCPPGEACEGGFCALPAPGGSSGEAGGSPGEPDAAPGTAAPPADAAPAVDPAELVLHPVADAYVEEEAPLANHGSSELLRIDGEPETTAYLRFDRGGAAQEDELPAVASARLELYARSDQAGGYRVSAAGGGWSEATVTFATAPAIGAPIASSGAVAAGRWIAVDVTAAVAGRGQVDLALSTDEVTAIALSSREDEEYVPRLVIAPAPR